MYSAYKLNQIRSDQISHSVVSDSLRPHESQHARPPCPSPIPGVHSDSCPSSQWCHRTISSSVSHFSSCLPSFPVSGFFKWVSSLHQMAKVLEFQLQHQSFQWIFRLISFRMDWVDFFAVQGTLKSLLQHHSSKASILRHSAFFMVQFSYPYMTTGKTCWLGMQVYFTKSTSSIMHQCELVLNHSVVSDSLQSHGL